MPSYEEKIDEVDTSFDVYMRSNSSTALQDIITDTYRYHATTNDHEDESDDECDYENSKAHREQCHRDHEDKDNDEQHGSDQQEQREHQKVKQEEQEHDDRDRQQQHGEQDEKQQQSELDEQQQSQKQEQLQVEQDVQQHCKQKEYIRRYQNEQSIIEQEGNGKSGCDDEHEYDQRYVHEYDPGNEHADEQRNNQNNEGDK